MLFCCCFCRAAAVSPKKVEEDNISSWRPQQTQTEQVILSVKSSLVAERAGGPHGQMAAEAGRLPTPTAAPLPTI